jgi:hypothetical protein
MIDDSIFLVGVEWIPVLAKHIARRDRKYPFFSTHCDRTEVNTLMRPVLLDLYLRAGWQGE